MSDPAPSEEKGTLETRIFPLHAQSGEGETPERARQNALAALKPHLPVSLPLYRRLQFGRFFEATTLAANLSLDKQAEGQSSRDTQEPWLIAFVDRSCRPETEVWLFCSWEAPARNTSSSDDGKAENLLRSLLKSLKALPIPRSIHQDILDAKAAEIGKQADDAKDSVGLGKSDYAAHMLDPNIMLWGSIHEKTLPLLQRLGVASGERFKAAAMPNLMFTWDVDSLAMSTDLPGGVQWGELKRQHFPLVRARTQIPRQDCTLAVLPNLGIFPATVNGSQADPDPIAWVFVGLDGSLTTLHVEAEWRGRGLAKAITTKLFREKMGLFWERGMTKWAHGYVIRGNQESEGMCRSLKGTSDWDVYWVRVDLGAVWAIPGQ